MKTSLVILNLNTGEASHYFFARVHAGHVKALAKKEVTERIGLEIGIDAEMNIINSFGRRVIVVTHK